MNIETCYIIEDKIVISFITKTIWSCDMDLQVVYILLKEAWRVHDEFRKYRFPMIGISKLGEPPIFDILDDWEVI